MSGTRPNLFEEDLDLSQFSPQSEVPSVPDTTVRQVSEEGGFPSRAPQVTRRPTQRPPLVYRTGRNVTFSAKTTPETVDAFYKIAREQGWKAGETFENAIQALIEKLKRSK